MILADKIILLRKKSGWSQEELAEKMNVSRQSVSKWEGANSIPDISKIIDMSKIFGVSTDYLLMDDSAEAVYEDNYSGESIRVISLPEAQSFMKDMKNYARKIATGVLLCILGVMTLILIVGAAEGKLIYLSEDAAAGIGVTVLLLLVAAAVAIFIMSGIRMQNYELMKKGDFNLDYGVRELVIEKKRAHEGNYIASIVVGVILCIVGVIPLILAGVSGASDMVCIGFLSLMFVMDGIAVYLFIVAGMIRSSFDQLIGEGDYRPQERERVEKEDKIGEVYWPVMVAIYLAWSFLTNDWQITWVVWPVAGLLFAAITAAISIKKGDK